MGSRQGHPIGPLASVGLTTEVRVSNIGEAIFPACNPARWPDKKVWKTNAYKLQQLRNFRHSLWRLRSSEQSSVWHLDQFRRTSAFVPTFVLQQKCQIEPRSEPALSDPVCSFAPAYDNNAHHAGWQVLHMISRTAAAGVDQPMWRRFLSGCISHIPSQWKPDVCKAFFMYLHQQCPTEFTVQQVHTRQYCTIDGQ